MPISEAPNVQRSKTFKALFVTTTVSGVAYYRMCQSAWLMRSWPGVQTVVWPYSKNTTIQNPWQVDIVDSPEVRSILTNLIDGADIVVWQMLDFEHSLEFWMDLKNRYQKPFLMEIDDYLADIPVDNAGFQQMRPGSKRYQIATEQMRHSDGLICSTPYLASQYKDFNENIHVIPNSIDLKEWDGIRQRSNDKRIRIGWIGGGTHKADLDMVHPAITEVLDRYKHKNVWFYCIHGAPESFKGEERIYWTHKWSKINLYPKFLASYKFDIGIAPLEDNNFNRGKSNLRWLEYSALAIPTVASPLPDFTRVIEHGRNGFIADTMEDWIKSLGTCIEERLARVNVGMNAYQTVKNDFNARKTSTKYMRLLKEIANGVLSSNAV